MPKPAPPVPPLLYVNVWKARDGSFEAQAHASRDDALEGVGAEYPGMSYAGTATLPQHGDRALFENWSDEAHSHAVEATEDWLDEQRERQAYLAKVL